MKINSQNNKNDLESCGWHGMKNSKTLKDNIRASEKSKAYLNLRRNQLVTFWLWCCLALFSVQNILNLSFYFKFTDISIHVETVSWKKKIKKNSYLKIST